MFCFNKDDRNDGFILSVICFCNFKHAHMYLSLPYVNIVRDCCSNAVVGHTRLQRLSDIDDSGFNSTHFIVNYLKLGMD